ncbi:24154_t:CDS:1, partial [Racocetra persica]
KNLRKHFDNDSYDKIIKIIDRIIYLRDNNALNLTIASYKALVKSSFNANEAIKYFDREVYTIRQKYMDVLDLG